jgi:hypothetical protein
VGPVRLVPAGAGPQATAPTQDTAARRAWQRLSEASAPRGPQAFKLLTRLATEGAPVEQAHLEECAKRYARRGDRRGVRDVVRWAEARVRAAAACCAHAGVAGARQLLQGWG